MGKRIITPKKTYVPDWFLQYESQILELQIKKFEIEQELSKIKKKVIEEIQADPNIERRITSEFVSVSLVKEQSKYIFNTEQFRRDFPKRYKEYLTKPSHKKAFLQVNILDKKKIKK